MRDWILRLIVQGITRSVARLLEEGQPPLALTQAPIYVAPNGAAGMPDDTTHDFIQAALGFCEWAERPPDPESDLLQALRHLSRLYCFALDLPDAAPNELSDGVRDNEHSGELVYRRFQTLPVGFYSEVFDPLAVPTEDPGTGDLADDLRDIYIDLKRGLTLHQAGRPNDALFEWCLSFRAHWGRHATSALRVIHGYVMS